MAQFSGAVRIGDVSDFIAPTQACVVNLDGSQKAAAPVRVFLPHRRPVALRAPIGLAHRSAAPRPAASSAGASTCAQGRLQPLSRCACRRRRPPRAGSSRRRSTLAAAPSR